jgi:hypothetical protein
MADLPKRPRWLQEIAENSKFSSGAGPFYTLSLELTFPDGQSGSKPFNIDQFGAIEKTNMVWAQNPKIGDGHPTQIQLWLVREETFVTDEKEYCNPDEKTLLWSWEARCRD